MSKQYLTTNVLMRHLRDSGIQIDGSYQKRQLINFGYYHGYKGFRFFSSRNNTIPFNDYKQVIAVVNYDSKIKAMFYQHLMFIETALKNITLEIILKEANSHELNVISSKLIPGYVGAPTGTTPERKIKMQRKKLALQNKIRSSLLQSYEKENKIVTHFYNNINYSDVPIWAIFEILTLGEFGMFISCLNQDTRKKISQYIGLDLSGDTNVTLIYQIIYVIKDLRNAVAHNDVVFDTRFRKSNITRPIQVCLTHEVGVKYVNFKSLADYVVLIAYMLKKFKSPKYEILSLVSSFEKCLKDLHKDIPNSIYEMIVHTDTTKKLTTLRKYIKK
ncbi:MULTISPECIES: Abi family protein [unclassified Clostridium]|uniref:Abi family protein n=1 Tax=unclassified Clostridium TaxID=2614128 RepID=UPI003F90C22F